MRALDRQLSVHSCHIAKTGNGRTTCSWLHSSVKHHLSDSCRHGRIWSFQHNRYSFSSWPSAHERQNTREAYSPDKFRSTEDSFNMLKRNRKTSQLHGGIAGSVGELCTDSGRKDGLSLEEKQQRYVDRQVYTQVAASRNRLSQQLSAKNKYICHLERTLNKRCQAVTDAHNALLRVHKELEALKKQSEVAVAAAAYAVDKSDVVLRGQRLVQRAESLQKGISTEADELDKLVLRQVPIAWYGVASDVKLLGDFDSWTQGFSLSPSEIQDQTFTKFTAVITLLPGRYLVKFKIDGSHWRLAPDWPTKDSADGSINNVLIVA